MPGRARAENMRTGGYAVQQALGAEAAAAVRQAASLARQRGHAQVTPLHVAIAVLSAATSPGGGGGLLHAACLRSHPDPRQHEALELCLGAALCRLPVAWPWPAAAAASRHGSQGQHGIIHHGHHAAPAALSNALVAALKRAQAHQRRGSGGMDGGLQQGQRQPAAAALAGKVELEQLVVSILDDPSVDRAMREAGFSSSQVKANVENSAAASLEHSHSASIDTTCPNPVHKKIRIGAGHPSREVQHRPVVVTDRRSELALSLISCHSGDQASQAKSRTRRPALIGGTATATTSLPPWLRCSRDPTLRESTHYNINFQATYHRPKFTELTAENLKILCNALEQRVPLHHKGVVLSIASTVLRCRSGMMRRVRRSSTSSVTWLLFHGKDVHDKTTIAQELAKLVFGSYTDFTLVNSISNSSCELTLQRKRPRDDDKNGYVGTRLFEAILENPHRVIWIDDIDELDHESEIAIRNVIAKGRIVGCNGNVVNLEDAIIVLSSEALDSRCLAASRQVNQQIDKQNCEEYIMHKGVKSRRLSLDLNACSGADEDEGDSSSDDVLGIMNIADGVFCFD